MQLELSEEERAFRDEMREFFTTKVSEEIRETVAAGRELTKDQLVESSGRSTPRGSPYPAGRSSGAARTGPRSSSTSGARRWSAPACRPRSRSTPG